MNEYTAFYLFCGIGGMAIGGQRGRAEYKGEVARFRTLGGIDCDREACEDFTKLTGVPAACLDLFSESDYVSFHGHQPPPGWREANAKNILAAAGWEYPDMVALSPPCKGFSGLLPAKSAASERYQALNRLTVRGLRLTLEAFEEDLPAVILIENVPRITSRGAELLRQVKDLLGKHGYLFTEGYHDCGELGGLAQHRKRYLLIARLEEKMSSFIYRPPVKRVKTIGEVIGPIPLPDDPTMGPMHRLPRLQWKTWVRLALIPAGGDWRDLEKAGQYRLEYIPRGGGWQIAAWDDTAGTIVGSARIGHSNGVASISDPRLNLDKESTHRAIYKVTSWEETAGTVTGAHGPSNGTITISDPRVTKQSFSNCYQLNNWDGPSGTVTGIPDIQNGAQSIADRRIPFNNIFQVTSLEDVPGAVTSGNGQTGTVIADPRLTCQPRNGTMGVQHWDNPSSTIIGAGDVHAGAAAVADPRIPRDNEILDPPPVIVALDGTWHRPLTTLELAILQGFDFIMPDGSPLKLSGKSDQRWRERIGNAVPPPAFEAIAEEILLALLVNNKREWVLSSTDIWVKPVNSGMEYSVYSE